MTSRYRPPDGRPDGGTGYKTRTLQGSLSQHMTYSPRTRRSESRDVLLVEDNPGDTRLVEEAFREVSLDATLHTVSDGDELLDFLFQRSDYESAPFPDLVLLDLNLPGTHGTELLERIRTDPKHRHLPVVILTSSADRDDVVDCYRNHANAYLTKPTDHDDFVSLVESLDDFWFDQVQLPPAR